MRLLLLILLSLIIAAAPSKGQSVFELECRLPGAGNQRANALLVYEKDGSGFIRMSWRDVRRKATIITDLQLLSARRIKIPGPDDPRPLREGQTFVLCLAKPVRNALGKTAFPAAAFIFWMVDDGRGLKPYTGRLPRFDTGDHSGVPRFPGFIDSPSVTGARPIPGRQLVSRLFNKYFAPEEEVYPYPVTVAQLHAIRGKYTATLHCITVTNTDDAKIAATTVIDREHIDMIFRDAAESTHIRYHRVRLEGADFNLARLESVIRSLRVGKNDIIVFAYSGHGFSYTNDPGYQYPQLALWNGVRNAAYFRANSINLETVFNRIRAKGARLNLVLGDCCNTDAGITREIDSEQIAPGVVPVPPLVIRGNFMRLMIEAKGSYIACAAKKGQPAAGNKYDGGFFTYFVVEYLVAKSRSIDGFNPQTGWTDILESAGKAAKDRAATLQCRELNGPCRQEMVYRKVTAGRR